MEKVVLHKNTRYLKRDDGRIFVYSKILAKRKDMRDFVPDFKDDGVSGEVNNFNLETPESLADKTKDQLCDYAMSIYGKKLDKRETHAALVEQILELQKMAV